MKRRKFVFGLGATTFGTAMTVGSGAFTSVRAKRNLTVDVVQDSDALLKLDAEGSPNRSSAGDTVELDFPGTQESDLNPQNPSGVNKDSITRFSSEPNSNNSDGLIRVTNQGTQVVNIYGTQNPDPGEPKVDLFNVKSGNLLTEQSPYRNLGVGEKLKIGVQIDTTGVSTAEYDLSLTIVGEVSDGNS